MKGHGLGLERFASLESPSDAAAPGRATRALLREGRHHREQAIPDQQVHRRRVEDEPVHVLEGVDAEVVELLASVVDEVDELVSLGPDRPPVLHGVVRTGEPKVAA